MSTTTWALPVGILAALCVLMFAFIWWWFPRAYRKGVKADMDRVDEDRRNREAYEATQRDLELQADANAAMERNGGEDGAPPGYARTADEGGNTVTAPPKTFKYTPPAYTSY